MFEDTETVDKTVEKTPEATTSEDKTPDLAMLMKRLTDKDAFIEKLLQERRDDEAKLKAYEDKEKAKEFEEKLVKPEDNTPQGTPLDVEAKVKELLEQQFQARDQKAVLKDFESFMINQYENAAKAKEVFESKAQALGTTPKALEEMVKTNPAVVKALFQPQGQSSQTKTLDQGTVQTSIQNSGQAGEVLAEMKKQLRKNPNIMVTDKTWQKRYDEAYLAAKMQKG